MQPLKVSYTLLKPFKIEIARGPFSNYVDKMRGEGSKMSVFVHTPSIKTVHAGHIDKGGYSNSSRLKIWTFSLHHGAF